MNKIETELPKLPINLSKRLLTMKRT